MAPCSLLLFQVMLTVSFWFVGCYVDTKQTFANKTRKLITRHLLIRSQQSQVLRNAYLFTYQCCNVLHLFDRFYCCNDARDLVLAKVSVPACGVWKSKTKRRSPKQIFENNRESECVQKATAVRYAYYQNVMHYSTYRGMSIECDI